MFEGFQNFIPKIANQYKISHALDASHICEVARKVLHTNYQDFEKHCHIKSFKDGVINMTCDNSVLANELHYAQTEFINAINQSLPSKKITYLKVTVKSVEEEIF
jgi:hypothetical protein